MLPIGGPGQALSAKEQADILFRLTGLPPKYFPVPVALMDGIIGLLDLLSKAFPQLKVRGAALKGWLCSKHTLRNSWLRNQLQGWVIQYGVGGAV